MLVRATAFVSVTLVALSMNAQLAFAGTLVSAGEANPPLTGAEKLTKEMVRQNRKHMQESIYDAIGRWSAATAVNQLPANESPLQYLQTRVELNP